MNESCRCADETTCFPSYADVLEYLNGLGLFHMELDLNRMYRALAAFKITKMPCPVVQIVGTNGKGSVATFLQSLAMEHGLRAGLFTSPHFVSPTERIRLNNQALPEAAWPRLAGKAVQAEPGLTYFELLTVMAVLAFQDAEPDVLIFEAGLGGRYDATSSLPVDLVCFTPIGLDHTEILGPDLASIAADKADALRPGVFAAVSAPQEPEAWAALRQKASALNIPLYTATPETARNTTGRTQKPEATPTQLPPLFALSEEGAAVRLPQNAILGLTGPHQRMNAGTALAVWSVLCRQYGWRTHEGAVRRGLARAFLPGRLQHVPAQNNKTTFVLDGAHNTHGMSALIQAVREWPVPPSAVIFSCLADKSPTEMALMVRELAGSTPVWVPTISHNSRAMQGEALAELIGPQAKAVPDMATALVRCQGADHAPVLVCGSLYLLSEFFTLFPQALTARQV